jgi:putative ABC transport system ATP-binding protein
VSEHTIPAGQRDLVPGDGPVAGQAVRLAGVSKRYGPRHHQVLALNAVTVGFACGTFTAIMGPSGSGKSTLLQCAAGLDSIDAGEIFLGPRALRGLSARQLTLLRRDSLGFIFQAYNLVPVLTARQNVELPLRLAGRRPGRAATDSILGALGIAEHADRVPSQLSGGQQQRVAIARALITRPEVLFADEPTGALDSRASGEILALLRELVDSTGQTIVMVTHDPRAASFADRVVFLKDGQVAGELAGPTQEGVALRMARLDAT